MVLVRRIIARQQAGVEQPQVHCSGLFALTSSTTPPPWLVIGPPMASISAIRSARRALLRRKLSSASSRRYPLRVVPRRSASMSTAQSRSSGSDTITLAISSVYPVLPAGTDEPAHGVSVSFRGACTLGIGQVWGGLRRRERHLSGRPVAVSTVGGVAVRGSAWTPAWYLEPVGVRAGGVVLTTAFGTLARMDRLRVATRCDDEVDRRRAEASTLARVVSKCVVFGTTFPGPPRTLKTIFSAARP